MTREPRLVPPVALPTAAAEPLRPDCCGVARLHLSDYVPPGKFYRMVPQPGLTGHDRPLVVMARADAERIRTSWARLGVEDVDQAIADHCEQAFQDAMRARP